MGTTRVKVVDLSSENTEVKASRKHAAKIKPQIKESNVEEEKAEVKTEESEQVETPSAKKAQAKTSKGKTSKHHQGANYQKALKAIDATKAYSAKEAYKLLEETSFTKFDPTVEIHINVSEKNLRGKVSFPHPIGPKKEKRFLVFAKFKSDSKNVISGSAETVKEIEEGRLKPVRDFDVVIASAEFMPQLVKIAKVLGPAGMMPNPKNGTITSNPQSLIEGKDSDAYEFRSDPLAPVIHAKLGKLSAKEAAINENLKALILAIGTSKIKRVILTTSMGPGIQLDPSTL